MGALQWMGAVRMRVQTADKNITIIHTTPVHQLTSWEDKSWNKSIFKTFLTLNHCFLQKYKSRIHNNTSWIRSESGEKSAQINHCLQDKTVQNNSKQTFHFFWLFHWRKRYYGLWTHILARSLLCNTCILYSFSNCLFSLSKINKTPLTLAFSILFYSIYLFSFYCMYIYVYVLYTVYKPLLHVLR